MALKLKQAGKDPIGQFDGYDADYLTIKGGEVGTLIRVPYTYPGSADKAASDVFDGYSGTPTKYRPAVTHTLGSSDHKSTFRPLFLLDEGTIGYGTMFGTIVGGLTGQSVPNPSNLVGATVIGPSTVVGSGKVTCWDKPGLYGVTLDAVATSVDPKTSNPMPGDPVYANDNGQLTLTSGESFDSAADGGPTIVGRFVEFSTNGSKVTTNINKTLTEMVFTFNIEN